MPYSRKDGDDSGGSTDSDTDGESEESRRRRKKDKKSKKKAEKVRRIDMRCHPMFVVVGCVSPPTRGSFSNEGSKNNENGATQKRCFFLGFISSSK